MSAKGTSSNFLGFKKLPIELRESSLSEQEKWERILGTGFLWPLCPVCKRRLYDVTMDIEIGLGAPYLSQPVSSSVVVISNPPNIHVMLRCYKCHSRIYGYSRTLYFQEEREGIVLDSFEVTEIIEGKKE